MQTLDVRKAFDSYAIVALCFIVLILPISFSEAIEKLTNIDYIGLGYDVILGNPHSEFYDPGFKEAIFDLTYNDQSTSSDGKWLVPDKIQALQTLACSYRTESTEVNGMSSYRDKLSVDAKVNGEGWGAKFSGSTDYKHVKEGTDKYHKTYVESVAKCIQYRALIRSRSGIGLAIHFQNSVHELPEEEDDEEYMSFIEAYGTHYASIVVMGAKAIVRSEFNQMSWTRMEQTNLNIEAAAEASFKGFTGGASSSTDQERNMRSEFESKRTAYKAAFQGSRPSMDGRWETWAQTSGESPYPIEYTLRPLTELLSARYIRAENATRLEVKRQLLAAAYSRYCGRVDGCAVPLADRSPVKMEKMESSIRGYALLTCRTGYTVLSCGLGNIGGTTPEDFRYAYPVSSTTCACYDHFGARCVAWCTNAVSGYSIQSSGQRSDVFSATCPAGQKAVGCHIVPTFVRREKWRRHYPENGGNSCTCYDYFGGNCFATCASNIYDYEVRHQFGHGVVTVGCSANNYVLGCGTNPSVNHGPERWRTMHVATMTSCECYDDFGVTCYAICGKFN